MSDGSDNKFSSSSAAWPANADFITMYGVGSGPFDPPYEPLVPLVPLVSPLRPLLPQSHNQVFALRNILGQLLMMAELADREEVAMAYREAAALVQDHLNSLV